MASKVVSSAIAGNAVVVFSKTYCPYCVKAKDALAQALASLEDISFDSAVTVLELDKRPDGPALQAAVSATSGVRTVPQVFVGGAFVGGGDDVAALQRKGKLAKMVATAVASRS
ncbi:hypothetical protein MMPV_003740 [Pyropia vietnamensis]